MSDSILTSTPVGTPSFKHHWTGWLGLFLVPLLPWIWNILSIAKITYTHEAGKVWVGIIIASVWVLTSVFFLLVSQIGAVKETAENDNDSLESSSALVNDLAFFKASTGLSLAYFFAELVVFLIYFRLPPTSTIQGSFHKTDVDLFILVGVQRIVAAMGAHLIGYILSSISVLVFFMPWSHFGLANALINMVSGSKKARKEAITEAYGATAGGSNKPISKWGQQAAKS